MTPTPSTRSASSSIGWPTPATGVLFEPGDVEAVLSEPVALLSELGELNFLLSDGIHLVAYANTKLHRVQRTCVERSGRQQAVVLATTPLTDEPWQPVDHGRLHIFAGGTETRRSEVAA